MSLVIILESGRTNSHSPHLTGGQTEAQRKDVTCPRSHHEIGPSLAWYRGSGWTPFSSSCTMCSAPQGRRTLCDSADKELCLLSSFPFSSMMCQLSVVESKSATFPSEKARHLLDDSVLESRSPRRGLALTSSSAVTNGLSLGKRLRPAHDSGRASVPCVLRVCLCHCAVPGGPSPSAERAPPQEEVCFPVSRALRSAPGVTSPCPERGRQVDGSRTHTRDPLSLLATARGWPLPQQGSCPGRGP